MKQIAGVLAGMSLLALGLSASVPADHRVEITERGFAPQTVEVTEGHKVTWMNNTKNEHSVTARVKAEPGQNKDKQDKPLFDSGPIKAGGTFEYTFSKAGTYEYGCGMDKAMTGTVFVQAKP